MIKYINLKKKTFEGVLSSSMKNGKKMGTLVPKGLSKSLRPISCRDSYPYSTVYQSLFQKGNVDRLTRSSDWLCE